MRGCEQTYPVLRSEVDDGVLGTELLVDKALILFFAMPCRRASPTSQHHRESWCQVSGVSAIVLRTTLYRTDWYWSWNLEPGSDWAFRLPPWDMI